MRAKCCATVGSCRCEANRPKRPSKTRGRPGGAGLRQQRRGHAVLRREPRVQELRTACRRPSIRAAPRRSCRRCRPPTPSAPASRPRSLPARRRCRTARTVRWDESRADGTARAPRCRRGRRSRCRRRWPAIRSRPDDRRDLGAAPAPRPPPGCSCARSTRCACRRTRAPARTTALARRPNGAAVRSPDPHTRLGLRRHRVGARRRPNGVSGAGAATGR